MHIKKPALQLWIKLQFNNTGFTDDKTFNRNYGMRKNRRTEAVSRLNTDREQCQTLQWASAGRNETYAFPSEQK